MDAQEALEIGKQKPHLVTLEEAVRKSTTKRGKRSWNLHCPVKCGRCCTESRYEPKLFRFTLPTGDGADLVAHGLGDLCPHHGVKGCKLPRKARPANCTGFLCPVAESVIVGDLTLDQGRQVTRDLMPWLYRRYDFEWKESIRQRMFDYLLGKEKKGEKEARLAARAVLVEAPRRSPLRLNPVYRLGGVERRTMHGLTRAVDKVEEKQKPRRKVGRAQLVRDRVEGLLFELFRRDISVTTIQNAIADAIDDRQIKGDSEPLANYVRELAGALLDGTEKK